MPERSPSPSSIGSGSVSAYPSGSLNSGPLGRRGFAQNIKELTLPDPNLSGFGIGDTVWSPCEQHGFRKSMIVSRDDENYSFLLGNQRGQERVPQSECRPLYDTQPDRTCDDNTSLVHLDDANILDNLQRRFVRDEIYTYTANVLLAVNPYKTLPGLYTLERMQEYKGRHIGALPPHPYAIADSAYRQLRNERKDQALVISGESGAGKTETAKIVAQYLVSNSRTDAERGSLIRERIVNAAPILESFGNASTVRNRNSSRFGKYSEMYFDKVGSLIGAGVKTFLLESSRVVAPQEAERNYHVFYELLAGIPAAQLADFGLEANGRYQLLHPGKARNNYAMDRVNEEHEPLLKFKMLRDAFSAVGIGQEIEQDIFETLAALVHLGELGFEEAEPEDGVSIINQNNLDWAASLLGLSADGLRDVIRQKTVHVDGQEIARFRKKAQAQQTLQSIAKALYSRLFDKIVGFIDRAGSQGASCASRDQGSMQRIGTLDIYGFERLQVNSFEQLCINLANERLQQFFIEEVLRVEQKMYKEEGLNVEPFELPDGTPVVVGIQTLLGILDEHSLRSCKSLSGNEPDREFCSHVHRALTEGADRDAPVTPLKLKASRSGMSLGRNDGFQIRHYAGDVAYSTQGFIEKNNDALVPEVEVLLRQSTKGLVKSLGSAHGATAHGERVHSVARRFNADLENLLQTLKSCSVHYIRCFNPNQTLQAGVFDKKYVLEQVIQCGTVELVRLMHNGFPHRCLLRELRTRFKDMLPKDMVENYSNHHFAHAIMLAFSIEQSQWTLGTERLFLKAGQLRVLEHLRDAGCKATRETLQRIRAIFARKRLRGAFHSICLALWLPRHVRRKRMEGFYKGLIKAVHIYVRLHRWLRAAREKLYGPIKTLGMTDLSMHAFGIAWSSQGTPAAPELFVALNRFEVADVKTPLSVGSIALRKMQGEQEESVILYDGRNVSCARLRVDATSNGNSGRCSQASNASGFPDLGLEDPRRLDLVETFCALPPGCVSATGSKRNVVCMCQHRQDPQIFATCDSRGCGMVWRWLGTRPCEPERRAIRSLGAFEFPGARIQRISFLSRGQGIGPGNKFTLAVLCDYPDRQWLHLHVVSVRGPVSNFRVLDSIHDIGMKVRAAPHALEPCFLTESLTGSLLVLGGRSLLQFYTINEVFANEHEEASMQPGRIELKLLHDCAIEFTDIMNGTMLSCLSMPPPNDMAEWIVVGDEKGCLYGFGFDMGDEGIELNVHVTGRFRTNKHAQYPICSLIGIYGESNDAHHQQLKESHRKTGYAQHVKDVQVLKKSFCSLGADSMMLAWQQEPERGWESRRMPGDDHVWPNSLALPDGATRRIIAGCASRLTPQVTIVAGVEKEDEAPFLLCVDRSSGRRGFAFRCV
eukprot:TRINITY_DN8236_c0_g4_i2.p1 TRINITY_DN8236_c0_g4~~TRINITY_DN8236_c0_g4_i2.p1  ORF type:complete len:1421 (+),score=272.10 TRINITY_DN8236_c0_g4_i2:108-4265(+)